MEADDLIKIATAAMQKAYSPYSECKVGAALLTKSGKVFEGCNVENASFGVTCCAERVAIFKAISEGETEFDAIAVAGGKNGVVADAFVPCGVCRQVMAEFCGPDFAVFVAKKDGYIKTTLGELLPLAFTSENLTDKGDNYER